VIKLEGVYYLLPRWKEKKEELRERGVAGQVIN